jgi:2,4-dienoyl-CoA reductase-like NADH-dependent reductase (Old Yellow Enzyme family)
MSVPAPVPDVTPPPGDPIFTPLRFRTLAVKNRIFRSNISGRFDFYNGAGSDARIRWEETFARGGVGAILSSHAPVHIRGRILPNYATIDSDARVPFWRRVGERVHRYDCKYILQLSHSGRQQDIGGVENQGRRALSSTSRREAMHGFPCQAMTRDEIRQTVQQFADGARRARQAGLDGVELHACNGYLLTQFLSSAINDRQDEYGGSLENRARILLEIIAAIRREAGADFHLQVKINGVDRNNAALFWEKPGNTLEEYLQICTWVDRAGADALHVSAGSSFPHPINPPGGFPTAVAAQTYDTMLSSGVTTLAVYKLVRFRPLRPIFNWIWNRSKGDVIEGINLPEARAIKTQVGIPVLCTGGFQRASLIRESITSGACDGVAIARPLVANPDLTRWFAQGQDLPDRPCTFCNKCLVHALENPLGCYEESRFRSYDEMIETIMDVFKVDEEMTVGGRG